MNKNETEILYRCYGQSKEGFALICNGIVKYANPALEGILRRDVSLCLVCDVFDADIGAGIKRAEESGEDVYLDCADVFGRKADIRIFKASDGVCMVFRDLDAMEYDIRRKDESFKLMKSTHNRMTSAITQTATTMELMIRRNGEKIPEEIRDYIKIIGQGVEKLSYTMQDITEIMDTQDLNADKGCRPGDLSVCAAAVVAAARRYFEAEGARLEIPGKQGCALMSFNYRSVSRMIYRILAHEIKRVRAGDTVRLEVAKYDTHAEISVRNKAVRESDRLIDFLKNPRVEMIEQMIEICGANLYLARRIALYYDGSFELENIGRGSKITVKLPCRQIMPYMQEPMEEFETRDPIEILFRVQE